MYKLVKEDNLFVIREKKTDSIIRSSDKREELYPLYRRLLGGTAFNGFTPSFFLQSIKSK